MHSGDFQFVNHVEKKSCQSLSGRLWERKLSPMVIYLVLHIHDAG